MLLTASEGERREEGRGWEAEKGGTGVEGEERRRGKDDVARVGGEVARAGERIYPVELPGQWWWEGEGEVVGV